MDDKRQTRLLKSLSLAELQFGNRQLIRISMRLRRDVAVAKGENTNVDIRFLHVIQTLVHRPLIGGDVVFHRNNVVAALAERLINDLAKFLQVFVGGRNINRRHNTGTPRPSQTGLSRVSLGVLYNVRLEKIKIRQRDRTSLSVP